MARHDVQCTFCGKTFPDHTITPWSDEAPCPACGRSSLTIIWSRSTPTTATTVHPSERIVVWENPSTGEVRYPGRNDVPMPVRYAQAGYRRKELCTLKEADSFCNSHKVINQKLHYDGGRDGFGD